MAAALGHDSHPLPVVVKDIVTKARTTWLKNDEVLNILLHYKVYDLPIGKEAPKSPGGKRFEPGRRSHKEDLSRENDASRLLMIRAEAVFVLGEVCTARPQETHAALPIITALFEQVFAKLTALPLSRRSPVSLQQKSCEVLPKRWP